eukprot:3733363-Pyramimonas_sp.AAC.1
MSSLVSFPFCRFSGGRCRSSSGPRWVIRLRGRGCADDALDDGDAPLGLGGTDAARAAGAAGPGSPGGGAGGSSARGASAGTVGCPSSGGAAGSASG